MTTLHLKLIRVRTAETTTMRLLDALKVITTYHDKQKFMNMLGQENFWKKNRLQLWKELVALDIKDTDEYRYNEADTTISTDFINTDYMLNNIRYQIQTYYTQRFTEKEDNILNTAEYFNHNNDYNYNNRIGRVKTLRTRQVHLHNLSVRHEDLQDFNKEVEALYKKYAVKNTERLKNGKRYFDAYEASERLTRLYYIR